MEVHGPGQPTEVSHTGTGTVRPPPTDSRGGRVEREVRMVDEIKLERRAKSRLREQGLPRGALP